MSDEKRIGAHAGPSSADRMVDAFHRIDEKVDAMREHRLNDPDSLGDKIVKWALPSVAGFVGGKLFQTIWNRGVSRRNVRRGRAADAPQGFLMQLLFTALSAAFGAFVSHVSNRGSEAIVDRLHRR
ncbi:DUF4235 domain-containing protein [Bifidobacterium parmae]|nr:DUF4235 domain-containing protein [Bifidobacterium parmae]